MPATAWTVEKSTVVAGLSPTLQAIDSANGNKFRQGGAKVRLRFNGAAAATGQVTIARQKLCSLGSTHNAQTASNALDATTKFREFGPFDLSFEDTNGDVQITYSGTVTGITVSVIQDA